MARPQTGRAPTQAALEQATGLEIEFFAVTSRTIAAEALRAEQVDVVLTGPAEYVVLRKLAGTSSRACRRPAASSTVIDEARAGGAAILGIFHDEDVRDRVVTRRLDLSLPESADA